MKSFWKHTFATLVALLIASVVTVVVGVCVLLVLVTAQEQPVKLKPNSIFMLSLEGTIEERVIENPLYDLFGSATKPAGLDEILSSIQKAKENPNIVGIYLQAGTFISSGTAMLQEIRQALLDFKTSGKFIVAYGDVYTQGGYYVCSVADQLILNPEGMVSWLGMASQPIYYKNTLEKIGVKMQVVKVGDYKSAVEPYVETQMSKSNREQITAVVSDIWKEIVEAVSHSRNIPMDSLNRYADDCVMFAPSSKLIDNKMIDQLLYRSEVIELLKHKAGVDENEKLNLVKLSQMTRVEESSSFIADQIAVYYAIGDIVEEASSSLSNNINRDKVCNDLRKLAQDENVKAVVIRVNSGGGSAYASEQIWHAVSQLRKKKPVVVSMGGVAASGAYYFACASNYIYAEPTTLTGSIGIFGLFPDASHLLQDKLGLRFDHVKTNRYADLGTIARPFNEEEKMLLQGYIERGYALFKKRVEEGRGLSASEVEKIAQGRVWTGNQALEHKLVDGLGGLDRAISQAATEAKLKHYELKNYPINEPWYLLLFENNVDQVVESQMMKFFGISSSQLNSLYHFDPRVNVQARAPYDLNLTH